MRTLVLALVAALIAPRGVAVPAGARTAPSGLTVPAGARAAPPGLTAPTGVRAAPPDGWAPPLVPLIVVRPFAPPAVRWGRGHRGVDLAGPPGAPVRAAADGVVSFAGRVAGVPVVTVRHGSLRTTYEPVLAAVPVGVPLRRGDVLGHLGRGHGPPGRPALHWGLLRGETYLDPLATLRRTRVRLLSLVPWR